MDQRGAAAGDAPNEANGIPLLWATPSFHSASSFVNYSCQLVPPAELIAVTGHSTIHKCFSLAFGCFVAIKVIDQKSIPETIASKFLPREIEVTKKVIHPNIVRCLHIIQPQPTKIIIVSEFCDGGTLLKYVLDYNGLGETEAARLFRQLIEAVHYLHTLSIAHRDIKLENILLDSFRVLKLADFGFAREAGKAEKSTSFCGTKPYSSPQLVDYVPYDSYAVDWYACGIVLFTMIAGNWPHDPHEKMTYPIKFPADKISYPARELIGKLLHNNEQKRGGYVDCCMSAWLSSFTANGIFYDGHHQSMVRPVGNL